MGPARADTDPDARGEADHQRSVSRVLESGGGRTSRQLLWRRGAASSWSKSTAHRLGPVRSKLGHHVVRPDTLKR